MIKLGWRQAFAVVSFFACAFLGIWGREIAWATPNQLPPLQTVPTRGPTATATPRPTNPPASIPTSTPTFVNTPTPVSSRTNTPVRPVETLAVASATAAAPTQISASPVPAGVIATANENLRIRSAPSTSAGIIGQLKQGDSAEVTGRSATSDWLQIAVPSTPNTRGWIASQYATASAPLTGVPVVSSGTAPPVVPTITLPPVIPVDMPTLVPQVFVLPSVTAPRAVDPQEPPDLAVPDGTERAANSQPLLSLLIGIVMLGLGGGFVMILFGGVMILAKRR